MKSTISSPISWPSRSQSVAMMIRLADRALYAAKGSGRNAWVGLWGHAADDGDVDAVLLDPVLEEAARRIAIVGSRDVRWPAPVGMVAPA